MLMEAIFFSLPNDLVTETCLVRSAFGTENRFDAESAHGGTDFSPTAANFWKLISQLHAQDVYE